MTQRINTPPRGLQSFLGSQNFGDNPSDLSQIVQPVLSVFPFYLGEKLERFYSAEITFTTETSQTITTVPDGKLWYVLRCGPAMRFNGAGAPTNEQVTAHIGMDDIPLRPGSLATALTPLSQGFKYIPATTGGNPQHFVDSFPTPVPVISGTRLTACTSDLVVGGGDTFLFRGFLEFVEVDL